MILRYVQLTNSMSNEAQGFSSASEHYRLISMDKELSEASCACDRGITGYVRMPLQKNQCKEVPVIVCVSFVRL